MTRRECTCAARDCGPGSGHETGCGLPDSCPPCEAINCAECEDYGADPVRGCCCGDLTVDDDEIAEGRLRARDYDGWARL